LCFSFTTTTRKKKRFIGVFCVVSRVLLFIQQIGDHVGSSGGRTSLQRRQPHHRRPQSQCQPGLPGR
jgi:hypothetical protein